MFQHKSISLADQIFERLESDILIGKYAYGTLLTETALSEELGVSRTPIREALRRLQQENLIKDTNKGMMVVGITEEDLKDIYNVRLKLEGMAIERFIENMTEESLAALKEILDFQEFYGGKHDSYHVIFKDSEFHESIYKNCGSPILCETLLPLHKKVVKFRQASIEKTGRTEKSINEHKALYNAIKQRDTASAKRLVEEHILNARNSIMGDK
ncbi:MAG: GntR family transcriptional regulator [Acutalibacteraceae bacterium]|nr:GntR family transcriptional regulator [Acutalibacteraceae bacterium]